MTFTERDVHIICTRFAELAKEADIDKAPDGWRLETVLIKKAIEERKEARKFWDRRNKI